MLSVGRRWVGWVGAGLLAAASACSDSSSNSVGPTGPTDPNQPSGPTTPATPATPTAVSAVLGTPANALIARVSFTTTSADSVRVALTPANGAVQYTPFKASSASGDTITVLGLRPNTSYTYTIEAKNSAGTVTSSQGTFTTAALPGQLGTVTLQQVNGVQHHMTATGVTVGGTNYAVIFDSTGTIVWYHDFATTQTVSNVLMQPNGNITAFVGNTSGWQPVDGYFVEMTPLGDIVHTYRAPAGSYMDLHDLLIAGSGASKTATYFTYTIRDTTLAALGMPGTISTAGHQIRRENSAGTLDFTWDAWDHIAATEWVGDSLAKATRGNNTDYDHPNAITTDAAGNYIVSWRNLDQIMAISPTTGAILWRLGGAKSDFTFVGDPLGGFFKQHAVKSLPNGDILLFDNGTEHSPMQSRAVEYKLDLNAHTATMVWESRHSPSLYAQYVGWVDRLANGNTWVAYSMLGRATEVNASGQTIWEGQLAIGPNQTPVAYRMVPIESLYGYVKP